jgi:hypothetical protein
VIDSFGIDEQRETGFGTGLRAHLTRDVPAAPGPPAPEQAELEHVQWEGEAQPVPEPDAGNERSRALEAYAAELAERERRLAELEEEVTGESRRLAAADAMLTAERRPVRDLLREHAEQQAERLVLTFEQALEATDHDGRPDFSTRLTALRLLLAEAYGGRAGEDAGASRVEDELGELRRRRGLA